MIQFYLFFSNFAITTFSQQQQQQEIIADVDELNLGEAEEAKT